MAEPEAKAPPPSGVAEDPHAAQWHELRDLLAGPERRQLDDLRARLDDPVRRAEELSQALPDALTLGQARGERLARSLQPTIDAALKVSVAKDPKAIADAIFPALGPAIRKAISAALMGMVQSLNHLLNQSFSPRGLRWRLEALRTRKPFGEVVLLHTLLYQVEQIFLIHRGSGVVLAQAAAGERLARDPDLVAGMLTAIQEFVKDSFDTQGAEMLDTLRMGGDHSVWIEQGPEAFLAVVLRGTPPLALRDRFRALLEEIHRLFAGQWAAFAGDTAAFALVRPRLEEALVGQQRDERRRPSPLLWVAGAALITAALAGGGWLHARRTHWRDTLTLLRGQSGIVVTSARQSWGRYYIEGLRDPLAQDPDALLAAAGIDPQRVHSRWSPYIALDEALVLRRAQARLAPPDGVTLALRHGVLSVSGPAPHDWAVRLQRQPPAIAGIDGWDLAHLEDPQMAGLQGLAHRLAGLNIGFRLGSAALDADQQPALDEAAGLVAQIQALRRQMAFSIQVAVIGHSDPTGSAQTNLRLSQERAQGVVQYFVSQGLDPIGLAAAGKGAPSKVAAGAPAAPADTDRRVTFQTYIDGKQVNPHD